ncbi:MAG TPA: SpoIVB peptidase S55 domain-containing protein, partial [Nannocystis sp.]
MNATNAMTTVTKQTKSRRRVGLGVLGFGLAALALTTDPVRAAPVDTMPVEDVRPGMKGYAVTVFSGTDSDRFEIEVIDVVRDYLPKQDAILFRSADPRMVHSGIVGGMSGSPIYIEGKLVGALAYGYRFNKDPIGGITPIKNMLTVSDLPFRPEVLPEARTGPRAQARNGAAGWADAMLGLGVSPLPARRRPADLDPVNGLAPIGAPMA